MSTPTTQPPPSDRLTDYFTYLGSVSPASLKVWASTGEAEFTAAVGDALEHAMKAIQADAALAAKELLSRRLVHHLSAAAVPCGAEEGHDGHVNVTVKHPAELAYTVRKALRPR